MNCDQTHKTTKMNIHNNIRIIQISDCHLSSDDQQQWFNRHPDQYLEGVIHYINNYEHDASVILATGDLSHDGSEKSYVKLAEYFSHLNNKVYAIAGNHDDPHNMNKYLNSITSGHVHQSHKSTIDGVDFFTCPSSCHQYLSHSNDFSVDEVAAVGLTSKIMEKLLAV